MKVILTVFLSDGNVLHIRDIETVFQTEGFLDGMDACTAWRMARRNWVEEYAEARDYTRIDAVKNLKLVLFSEQGTAIGTMSRLTLTEGHDQMGIVKRSRGYLRTVFDKLCKDLLEIGKHEKHSMAFKAINDTPSSQNGIAPTTLVYGVYARTPGGAGRE